MRQVNRGLLTLVQRDSCYAIKPPQETARSWFGSTVQQKIAPALLRITDLSYDRLAGIIASMGLSRFRCDQIWTAVYRTGALSWDEVTTLSAAHKQLMAGSLSLNTAMATEAPQRSTDGTMKWLIRTSTGVPVEAVLIPAQQIPGTGVINAGIGAHAVRRTLCVSSQAGCSLACRFCHTGTQRLGGNLRTGDIIDQVLVARRALLHVHGTDSSGVRNLPHRNTPPLHRIVFMGQGEPLLNWRAVRGAVETLVHPRGLAFAPRHITISTAGIAPAIPRVATETPLGVRLAVSLHAPDDSTRGQLMDVNASWPLHDLMSAVAEYIKLRRRAVVSLSENGPSSSTASASAAGDDSADGMDDDSDIDDQDSDVDNRALDVAKMARLDPAEALLRHNKVTVADRDKNGMPRVERHNGQRRVRVSFEYVLLKGVNDAPQQALAVASLLQTYIPLTAAHVNLIEYNAWPGSPFVGSDRHAVLAFQAALMSAGVRTTLRASRGQDVLGACGQLRSSSESKDRRREAAVCSR